MSLIKNAWNLGKGFFFDKEYKKKALILLILSIITNLSLIYFHVIINKWNNDFFNALQNFDKVTVYNSIKIFTLNLSGFIFAAVLSYIFQSKLQINWRQWMTNCYINKWTNSNSFYGINFFKSEQDNPDQRISEDINLYVKGSIGLTLTLLSKIITLFSFIMILWNLSGILKFTLFNRDLIIHGYLVWISLLYAGGGTIIAIILGKKLSALDYIQEKKEANFRFSLMRLRENAENISLYNGIKFETSNFKKLFSEIILNFNQLIKIGKDIRIFKNIYINCGNFIPIFAAAPKFFAKEIQFGGLMQINSAFNQIDEALSFIVQNLSEIAIYRAAVNRLSEFNDHINKWEILIKNSEIKVTHHDQNEIIIKDLNVKSPIDQILIKDLNITLTQGQSYLITGKNGAGKSTLLKAIRGIWPYGSGNITLPNYEDIFFIPQKTYMPSGTLVEIIAYPRSEINLDLIKTYMSKLNIDYLAPRLENIEDWSSTLSLGEQQKIAIIRALIAAPKVLIMDESTSAMAEDGEELSYRLLKETLPESIIISVGHRETLKQFHLQEIKV